MEEIKKGNIANALHSVAKAQVVTVAYEIYDEGLGVRQSELNVGVKNVIDEKHLYVRAANVTGKTESTITFDPTIVVTTQESYDNPGYTRRSNTLYLIESESKIVAAYYNDIPVDFNTETIVGILARIDTLEEDVATLGSLDSKAVEGLVEDLEDAISRLSSLEVSVGDFEYEQFSEERDKMLEADDRMESDIMKLQDDVISLSHMTDAFLGIVDEPEKLQDIGLNMRKNGWGFVGTDAEAMEIWWFEYKKNSVYKVGDKTYNILQFSEYVAKVDNLYRVYTQEQYELSPKREGMLYFILDEDEEQEQPQEDQE